MADIYAKLQKAIGATEHLMDILEEEKEKIHPTFSSDAVEGYIKFHNLSLYQNAKISPNKLEKIFYIVTI